MHRSPDDRDRGVTIVELSVAMLISALIAGAMLTWINAVGTADDRFRSNDELRYISDVILRNS